MSKSNNAVALGIRRGGEWVGMAAAVAVAVALAGREKDFCGTGLSSPTSCSLCHSLFLGLANWQNNLIPNDLFKFPVCLRAHAVAAVFVVYSIKNVQL